MPGFVKIRASFIIRPAKKEGENPAFCPFACIFVLKKHGIIQKTIMISLNKPLIRESAAAPDSHVYEVVYNLSLEYAERVKESFGNQVTGVVYISVRGKSVTLNLDALARDLRPPSLLVDGQPEQRTAELILPEHTGYARPSGSLGGAIDEIGGRDTTGRHLIRKFEMDFNGKDSRQANDNLGYFIIFLKKVCMDPDVRPTTRANYLYTFDKMVELASLADFSDVNFDFLKKFELWLSTKCGCNANTIAKHVKVLRKAVNQAIRLGYMDVRNDPFYEYSVRVKRSEKEVLTMNELAMIDSYFHRQFDSLPERDREILGAFLFGCYTGLRFSDLSKVPRKHIFKRRSKYWLEIDMQKTDKLVKIPLDDIFSGKAMAVLRRFNRKSGRLFAIPVNAVCNRRIKCLLKKVHKRIRYKYISFHTARRTMATLLLSLQVPITTVQAILGHASVKTTDVYAKVKEQTVYNDIRKARTKSMDKLFERTDKQMRRRMGQEGSR